MDQPKVRPAKAKTTPSGSMGSIPPAKRKKTGCESAYPDVPRVSDRLLEEACEDWAYKQSLDALVACNRVVKAEIDRRTQKRR